MLLNILDYTKRANQVWIDMQKKTATNYFRKTDFMKEIENEIEWGEGQKDKANPKNKTECENQKKF